MDKNYVPDVVRAVFEIVKDDYMLCLSFKEVLTKDPNSVNLSQQQWLTIYNQTTRQYCYLVKGYMEAASRLMITADNKELPLLVVECLSANGIVVVQPLDYFDRVRRISRSLVAKLVPGVSTLDNSVVKYAPPLPPTLDWQ